MVKDELDNRLGNLNFETMTVASQKRMLNAVQFLIVKDFFSLFFCLFLCLLVLFSFNASSTKRGSKTRGWKIYLALKEKMAKWSSAVERTNWPTPVKQPLFLGIFQEFGLSD